MTMRMPATRPSVRIGFGAYDLERERGTDFTVDHSIR
jgi:hypothetical protein